MKFTGDVRFVELSGEAYFDVKRDEALPFVVKTSRSEVMVLGTEFCVKDYVNQVNQTTLVSGSVSVKDFRGQSYVIVPGQQVCIDQDSSACWKSKLFISLLGRMDISCLIRPR